MIAARQQDQPIEPCRHMVNFVSALADGTLRGIARWYTRWHLLGCPRCRAALDALRALRQRMRALGAANEPGLSAASREALGNALDAIDRDAAGPPAGGGEK